MKAVAYEAIFIIDAATPDEQVKATIEKYAGVITGQGGSVEDIDRWDPRRLAYEIKRKREGFYVIMNFLATPEARDELQRIFGISDDILRAMIVRQHPKAERYPSRARAAEVERREREMAARASITAAPVSAEPITDLSASSDNGGVSGGNGGGNEAPSPEEPPVDEAVAVAETAETAETQDGGETGSGS